LPPILKFGTGVVEVIVSGGVPVATVETRTSPVILPVVVRLVPVAAPILGVVNIGLAAKTASPVPVSSESTPASCAEVVAAKTERLFSLNATVPVASGSVIVWSDVGPAIDSVVSFASAAAPSNTSGLPPVNMPDTVIVFDAFPNVTAPVPAVAIFTAFAPLPVPIFTVWAAVDEPTVIAPVVAAPPSVKLFPPSSIVVFVVSKPPKLTISPTRVNPFVKVKGFSYISVVHEGASVVPFDVSTCPDVPFASIAVVLAAD
jgi:hypothetical protein